MARGDVYLESRILAGRLEIRDYDRKTETYFWRPPEYDYEMTAGMLYVVADLVARIESLERQIEAADL